MYFVGLTVCQSNRLPIGWLAMLLQNYAAVDKTTSLNNGAVQTIAFIMMAICKSLLSFNDADSKKVFKRMVPK